MTNLYQVNYTPKGFGWNVPTMVRAETPEAARLQVEKPNIEVLSVSEACDMNAIASFLHRKAAAKS